MKDPTPRKTRIVGLGYANYGRLVGWRFVDLETGATIGLRYESRAELLADIDKFASDRGFTDYVRLPQFPKP